MATEEDMILDDDDLIDCVGLLKLLNEDSFIVDILKDNINKYIDETYCNQINQKIK